MSAEESEARDRAATLAAELHGLGRSEEARHLRHALAQKTREARESVLGMIEVIDPATETLLEELRADVDAWLTPRHPPALKA